jgi:cyclopropane fatty-acyl-phospholipid synthase-like methyltransferase
VGLDHSLSARSRLVDLFADYARTLREWDKRFVANVTPEVLAKDLPSMKMDPAVFEMFCKKWRYMFAYTNAGLEAGYVTNRMFTFIRPVCVLYIWLVFELTDA